MKDSDLPSDVLPSGPLVSNKLTLFGLATGG